MHYRTTGASGSSSGSSSSSSGGSAAAGQRTLLHFGAVDWNVDVYINRLWVGSHEGGYDGFTIDITQALARASDSVPEQAHATHELLLTVYDPSNKGPQPFGKQRIEAMYDPIRCLPNG